MGCRFQIFIWFFSFDLQLFSLPLFLHLKRIIKHLEFPLALNAAFGLQPFPFTPELFLSDLLFSLSASCPSLSVFRLQPFPLQPFSFNLFRFPLTFHAGWR
jgi:hypothetical protein